MKKTLLFLMLAAMTAFMACKGDDGPAGPPGADGINGTNGQDGNANVQSYTTAITGADWSADSEPRCTLNVAIVTADIANTGLVMVYFRGFFIGSIDGTTWTALPFSVAREFYTQTYGFAVAPNTVILSETASDGVPVRPEAEVRVVAVSADGRQAQINWENYAEVAEHFNLD